MLDLFFLHIFQSNDEFEGYIPAPAITEQPNDVNEVSPSGVVVKQEIDCFDEAYDAVTMATDEVPNQLLVDKSPPGGAIVKQEIDSSQEIKDAIRDEVPSRIPVNAAPSSGVIGELGIDSAYGIKYTVAMATDVVPNKVLINTLSSSGEIMKQEIDEHNETKEAVTMAIDAVSNQQSKPQSQFNKTPLVGVYVKKERNSVVEIRDAVTIATDEIPDQLQVKPQIGYSEEKKDDVTIATRPSGHSQENFHLVPHNPQLQRDESSHLPPIPGELNPLDLTLTNTRSPQSSSNLPPFVGYGQPPYAELTPGRGYPPRESANHSQIPSSSGMTPFMGNWHRPIGAPRETAPPLTHGRRLPNDDSGQDSGQRTIKDKGRFPSETRVGGSSVPHGSIVSPNMGSGSIIPPYMGGGSRILPYMGSWEHGQVVEISPRD